jgi:hypothetical protein
MYLDKAFWFVEKIGSMAGAISTLDPFDIKQLIINEYTIYTKCIDMVLK